LEDAVHRLRLAGKATEEECIALTALIESQSEDRQVDNHVTDDPELANRANLYASNVLHEEVNRPSAALDFGMVVAFLTDRLTKVIARAFVVGYAAGIEECSRTMRRK
jgi:hypothetical protein